MSSKYFKVYYDFSQQFDLKPAELLILSIIHSYTESGKEFFGKQESIANTVKISRQTANQCLKHLISKGLIEQKKKGRQTLYVSKIPTHQVSKKLTSGVKKSDTAVSKNLTSGVKNPDTPYYKQSHKKIDKQSNNGKPSFDTERYNNYVDNMELEYKK